VLVGRESERQVLSALVAGARVGAGASLVVSGEAGIGKSSLLVELAASAERDGMTVLRAAGAESERELPFGGLLQLLRPVLDLAATLPPAQASALDAALALGPDAGVGRFAVGAAVLGLLSRAAEDLPLAVVVDDAHLLDDSSAQALCFAARRLAADRVAIVLAVRTDAPCVVASAGLPELRLTGLDAGQADALVRDAGRHVSDDALTRLLTTTGGNPLALLELSRDGEVLDALPPGAPVPVPASLARLFARRADRLGPGARDVLLVAAAASGDLALVTRACADLGLDVADLDEAQAAELVTLEPGHVRFRHDLVRSGVYAEAAPSRRRAVHAALARALPDGDVDRLAWHLAEATVGPDDEAARALDRAAQAAAARGAHAVAAAASERAAALSERSRDRATRLVAAAEWAWRGGAADTTRRLLDDAGWLALDDPLGRRACALAGAVAERTGSVREARDLRVAAGTAAAADDPDAAVLLLADALEDCQWVFDRQAAEHIAVLVDDLLPRVQSVRARCVGGMATGLASVQLGTDGLGRIRASTELAAHDDELLADPDLAPWLAIGSLYLREEGEGRALLPTVVGHLRRRADLAGLPSLLARVGRDEATTDRWDDAVATYTEAIALARETGHLTGLTASLAGLAWLQARRGDATCRALAAEALDLSRAHGLHFFETWSLTALGEAELAAGRPREALVHLRAVQEVLAATQFSDVDVSPAPEIVDALLRTGDDDEARTLAIDHAERAEAKGQPWSLARAHRLLVMTGPDEDVDAEFAAAVVAHARTADPFEAARTRLAYGARLRRDRRRVESRPPLRHALATFDRLGAEPWAQQAAAELAATGETAQRRRVGDAERLTPQELQVARMLAGGRTTREAAAALFLSPKTIEYHLRHVYLKLDVRTRAELAAALRDEPTG
jgi:DNA-binding CsgD family transcriptional regulator